MLLTTASDERSGKPAHSRRLAPRPLRPVWFDRMRVANPTVDRCSEGVVTCEPPKAVKNAQRSKTVKVLSRGYANESSGASIKARVQKSGSS